MVRIRLKFIKFYHLDFIRTPTHSVPIYNLVLITKIRDKINKEMI